jgi:AcrR family transcriptional regulator
VSVRRRRTRLDPELRRAQILDAALRVFVMRGYHGAHVDHVITEAGVARGTFYLYFKSKHDVFAALVQRMLQLFLESRPPSPDVDVRSLADAERELRLSYRTLFETFRRHRHLCRLLLEEAVGLDKGFAEALDSHHRAWHARVAARLKHFVACRVACRDLDVELTAEMIIGLVERLTRRHLLSERPMSVDRMVEAAVRFELHGIQAAR